MSSASDIYLVAQTQEAITMSLGTGDVSVYPVQIERGSATVPLNQWNGDTIADFLFERRFLGGDIWYRQRVMMPPLTLRGLALLLTQWKADDQECPHTLATPHGFLHTVLGEADKPFQIPQQCRILQLPWFSQRSGAACMFPTRWHADDLDDYGNLQCACIVVTRHLCALFHPTYGLVTANLHAIKRAIRPAPARFCQPRRG